MADTESRAIPVRNPRTGGTEFSFPAATAQEIAHKAARLRLWAPRRKANTAAWKRMNC